MSRSIVLGCFIAFVGCGPDHPAVMHDDDAVGSHDATPQDAADDERRPEPETAPRPEPREHELADAKPDSPVLASTSGTGRRRRSSNRCERLRLHIDEDGRRRHRRVRRTWTEADRRRFARLVGLVSKEMGAEPRLIRAWAMRESTYRPTAMHALNPDIEAAMAAWRRLKYSPEEEAALQKTMADTSAQDSAYWQAKARLHEVQTFRDNPYLDEVIELEVVAPDGSTSPGTEPAWAFGYGPFGFNPAYFVPVWDSRAPPWVFCDDDGLAAIITAVWAARTAQRECEAQGFGGSYAVVNRRFSRGHCAEVGPTARFRGRARQVGLDPDARAKLGRRWRRDDTNREEILRHMRRKAVAAGLLTTRDGRGA